MCQHELGWATFAGIPFPVCFWSGWATTAILVGDWGGCWQRKKSSRCFVAHTCSHLSAGSSHWCEGVLRPATALTSPKSFFNFSNSWAWCVFHSQMKSLSFCGMPITPRTEAMRTDRGFSSCSCSRAPICPYSYFTKFICIYNVLHILDCVEQDSPHYLLVRRYRYIDIPRHIFPWWFCFSDWILTGLIRDTGGALGDRDLNHAGVRFLTLREKDSSITKEVLLQSKSTW